MRPLTEHQRELAEHRVALALAWQRLPQFDKDAVMWTARAVVRELERGAVHGASEKRGLEILSLQVPDEEATA